MSNPLAVTIIVEGLTELLFVKDVLAPHLAAKGVFITPIILSKPGQKGGDVRFVRVKNDIARHLKQRQDSYVSLLVDYYGIGHDWPGLDSVTPGSSPNDIASTICQATQAAIDADLTEYRSDKRFVPHISIHEFEALLFSEPAILAKSLGVDREKIDAIIEECGEPEAIDHSSQTSPSKRIEGLHSRFKKTSNGVAIARAIGIEKMRSKCPVFNGWLERLESLTTRVSGVRPYDKRNRDRAGHAEY
ncbi:MAG TPA: hypothetical protein DCS43_10440 [Verrucomicrobia bacterium]|nr:hypothetical protein [Verrucomicrobiota bacterium]